MTIGTNAKSQKGMNLANPHIFSFTIKTLPDTFPPYVVSTYPSEGTTNVSRTTMIQILWNESMNQTSAEGAFFSSPSVSCAWSWSGNAQLCLPKSPLQLSTRYQVMMIPLAKDLAGNAMKDVYTLNFTTEKGVSLPSPYVLETSPTNGSLDVPTNSNIIIVFSEEMNRVTSQWAISTNPFIFGAFSWDGSGKTMTWNPDPDLQAIPDTSLRWA